MKNKRIKPAFLVTKYTRDKLAGSTIENKLLDIVASVETMSGLYDGLVKLHSTPNPAVSREQSALQYKQRLDKAREMVRDRVIANGKHLDELEREIRRDAEIKAGLHSPLTESAAQEIRATLRSMKPKERDKALQDAALNGDAAILRAVREAATPWLVGDVGVPVEHLVEQLIQKNAPELTEQLSTIDEAGRRLELAADAFFKETETMREPYLESEAVRQSNELQQGEAMLAAAMRGIPSDGGE